MADNSPQPDWRAAAGGPRRVDKKFGWKPASAEATGGWKRPAKLFAVAGTVVAVVGGIVWLILLLLQPYRPGLITLAADPRFADQLDVPYDPYGWLSAKRLIEWANATEADRKGVKVLARSPEWADDWGVWIDKLRAEKVDPVVIYVGLHGGVGPDGKPILYTGRNPRANEGPATISLLDLIDKLGQVEKRKVLVLDVARGLPDPVLGEVNADFVRAMKADAVQDRIKATPDLLVICGADDGQRGWESADLGMTALSYQLLKGLSGEAAPRDMRAFTAADLYQYVRREVGEWAKNNRPTAQEPIIFPDPAADDRATVGYERRKFLLPDAGPTLSEIVTPAATQAEKVREQWARCAALAGRSPGPATYTPLAWRRYRDLLLRFEAAAMAGDADGLGVLGAALDRAFSQIENGLRLELPSAGWTLTLPAAAGQGPDALSAALWQAADAAAPGDLQTAANSMAEAVRGKAQRPTEVHYLLMSGNFFSKVVPSESPPAELWKPAVQARLRAEQAAAGVQKKSETLYPYSEFVWPLVRGVVLAADDARRKAEDAMLAGHGAGRDHYRTAEQGFDLSTKAYENALNSVTDVQSGLRVRDELFADMPYLSRWLAEADGTTAVVVSDAHKRACSVWVEGHQLAAQLDALAAKAALPPAAERLALAARVTELTTGLKELKDRFNEQVAGVNTATVQSQLQAIETLLLVPVPVIDTAGRMQLVETRRRIEKNLHDGSTPMGSEPKPSQTAKVKRRAEAILHAHGDPEWKQKVEREAALPNLGMAVQPLRNDKLELDATTAATTAAAGHAKAIAAAAMPPADKPELRVLAERFSRVAVSPVDPTLEPAVLNRKARCRALLDGQAARVARDHWYDEDGKPLFATIADAFLKNAATLAEQIGEQSAPPSEDALIAEALKKVPGLDLAAGVAGGQPVGGNIRWTTETARNLRLAVTKGGPPLTGSAVVWAASEEPAWLSVPGGSRDPFGLPKSTTDPPDGRDVRIEPGTKLRDASGPASAFVTVRAEGYFRGQRMKAEVRFAVNSRPDLVVTESRPDPGAMIALRASDAFDPGAISFLLDFSGSMSYRTDDGAVLPEGGHMNPASKMAVALAALEKVLPAIPDRTNVKVRIFSHKRPEKAEFDELIFPNRNRFDSDQFNRQQAAEILRALRGLTPHFKTPLVDTMRKAIQEDLAGTDTVKTLVVLTDGLDTSIGEVTRATPPAEKARIIKEVQAAVRDLKDSARAKNISIHMVFFALGEDKDVADEMFRDLNEADSARATANRIWRADDAEGLRNRLDKILRPKPRLFHKGGRLVEQVPAFGMPVNRAKDRPGELLWYGPQKIDTVTSDTYDLKFAATGVELKVAAGDRMVVGLANDPGRGVTFTREVYYKEVDPRAPADRVNDENPDWFLSVPWYNYARGPTHHLELAAALEAKGRPLAADEGVLKQPRPRFLWWELTRLVGTTEQASDRTVFVRNVVRDQFPAPAWRVIADDGPTATMEAARNRLTAFAIKDREPDPLVTFEVPDAAKLVGTPRPFSQKSEPIVVTIAIESIAFYPDPDVDQIHKTPGTKNLCLVVRTTDAKGRILHARVRGLGAVPTQEHRYFYQRDGNGPADPRPKVAGYTALFELGRESVANLPTLQIELISVTDLMADPRTARLRLDLNNPVSGQRKPLAIEPGQTADLGLR